jgi:hypothetical protein
MKTEYDLSKLTQEHIQELIKEPNIHEMFVRIGVVKSHLEVGKWYNIFCDAFHYLFYITKIENGQVFGYGLDEKNTFYEEASLCRLDDILNHYEATPEEVEKRLIEYAKEKYPKGSKVKHPLSEREFGFVDNIDCNDIENYIIVSDRFSPNGTSTILFENGVWSDILPQEETYIKIPLSEIKATPNYYELGALVVKKIDEQL